MLMTGFSVQGTSLKLLRSHERGVITRIKTLSEPMALKLTELGLVPGQSIAIKQRFPRFIVQVGNHSLALDEAAINAIYVRIVRR